MRMPPTAELASQLHCRWRQSRKSEFLVAELYPQAGFLLLFRCWCPFLRWKDGSMTSSWIQLPAWSLSMHVQFQCQVNDISCRGTPYEFHSSQLKVSFSPWFGKFDECVPSELEILHARWLTVCRPGPLGSLNVYGIFATILIINCSSRLTLWMLRCWECTHESRRLPHGTRTLLQTSWAHLSGPIAFGDSDVALFRFCVVNGCSLGSRLFHSFFSLQHNDHVFAIRKSVTKRLPQSVLSRLHLLVDTVDSSRARSSMQSRQCLCACITVATNTYLFNCTSSTGVGNFSCRRGRIWENKVLGGPECWVDTLIAYLSTYAKNHV